MLLVLVAAIHLQTTEKPAECWASRVYVLTAKASQLVIREGDIVLNSQLV